MTGKQYGELATEQQVSEAKSEAQKGMLTSLEFEQFKRDLMVAVDAITQQNNEVANRLKGNNNA